MVQHEHESPGSLSGMDSELLPLFSWQVDMNAYYPFQDPQPGPAQAGPQGSTGMSAHLDYCTDSESMPTQYTPYSTESQLKPPNNNHSHPHSEDFQQLYKTGESTIRQPYTHNSNAATYNSTNGTYIGIPLNSCSLYQHPMYNTPLTNSTNSFEQDGVSNGGPSSSKKRRRQFSPEDREKTKNVRKLGSCARCRRMKLKVIFPLLLLPH